jgi:hypothetical protein
VCRHTGHWATSAADRKKKAVSGPLCNHLKQNSNEILTDSNYFFLFALTALLGLTAFGLTAFDLTAFGKNIFSKPIYS